MADDACEAYRAIRNDLLESCDDAFRTGSIEYDVCTGTAWKYSQQLDEVCDQ